MTGSGVDRKPKVYLLYLGWGRVRCSSQGHQRAPQKFGWVQKAKQGCEKGGEGAVCVVCSRVLRQWPGSPSTKEGDRRDSRCRLMLRVFTVPWCVGNMLGPPARIQPALWERQGEKAHARGSFSCYNLLCSFPFLRHFCLSTCTSLKAVGVRSPFSPMQQVDGGCTYTVICGLWKQTTFVTHPFCSLSRCHLFIEKSKSKL